jgi:hypothetical protein
MSFKKNHINLSNYEEFFILYLDNELRADEKKMVDAFLSAHPHLQSEWDILRSARLPEESFSIDKEDLLASSMKQLQAEEELLLYMDDELDGDKKRTVALEIESNPSYKKQYALLSRTKLDAGEEIPYPHKEELYHRPSKRLSFRYGMRIAAAVVILAGMGLLLFTSEGGRVPPDTAALSPKTGPVAMGPGQLKKTPKKIQEDSRQLTQVKEGGDVEKPLISKTHTKKKQVTIMEVPRKEAAIASADPDTYPPSPGERSLAPIEGKASLHGKVITIEPSKEIINNTAVTSVLPSRTTPIKLASTEVPGKDVADNKGSFKSFLRKATRMIERKTGIDPTNGDDELLIGTVAVKLK